jgi:hypothetical protein
MQHPSPNIGTLLDNTFFQVCLCIGLRLSCNLCTPDICKYNAKVDEIGIHGLSCSKSSGRFSRHTEINCIINRSLTSIHVNSTLEPNGLSRDDGKRPDGMTLVPWIKGQSLVWEVTIVDTLADSYVLKTSEVSGFAAEMACKRNIIGNFCIIKQKCLCNYVILNIIITKKYNKINKLIIR